MNQIPTSDRRQEFPQTERGYFGEVDVCVQPLQLEGKEAVLLDPLSFSSQAVHLGIHAAVTDAFQEGKEIGALHALFDWTEIFRILDKAEHDSPLRGKQRMALLLDHDGRIIAASSLPRQRGLLLSTALASWLPAMGKQPSRWRNAWQLTS
jgi:hypothetical protein